MEKVRAISRKKNFKRTKKNQAPFPAIDISTSGDMKRDFTNFYVKLIHFFVKQYNQPEEGLSWSSSGLFAR